MAKEASYYHNRNDCVAKRNTITLTMNSVIFFWCALAFSQTIYAIPAVTRDTKVNLPGTERIYRRSPPTKNQVFSQTSSEEVFSYNKRSTNSQSGENLEMAENGLVFRPLFSQKQQRSPIKRSQRSLTKNDDINAAETGMVFLPLFKSKEKLETKQRVRRSDVMPSSSNVIGKSDVEISDDVLFKPLEKRKTRGVHFYDDDIFGSRLVFQNQYS